MSDIKYPAEYTAHWPSGPVNCCQLHANAIKNIGTLLGTHVAVTKAPEGSECSNCVNEAKAKEPS